jgi:hypothetical protein
MPIQNLSRFVSYRDTKTNIEMMSGTAEEMALSFASDTNQLGIFTNNAWAWINATGTAGTTDIGARVYRTTGIGLATAADTPIPFTAERWDTDNFHSGSSTQLFINTIGKYLIIGNFEFSGNDNTGRRELYIRLNGTTDIGRMNTNTMSVANIPTRMFVSTIYSLSVGNYVELVAFSSAAGVSGSAASNRSPEFSIQKIG